MTNEYYMKRVWIDYYWKTNDFSLWLSIYYCSEFYNICILKQIIWDVTNMLFKYL